MIVLVHVYQGMNLCTLTHTHICVYLSTKFEKSQKDT
jgi:hypothetical protein